MADNKRVAMLRNKIADFLEINDVFELLGIGFTQLNESPSAQSESTIYINEVSSTTDITGYETEFPFETDLIPAQPGVLALYNVGRNHYTGEKSQFQYARVDLWNPVKGSDGEFLARLFRVSAEVSDVEGDGGEKIAVSGTLYAQGDPVLGKFTLATKTFTAGEFEGEYTEESTGSGGGGSDPTPVAKTFTVTFNSNGGTDVPVQSVVEGNKITMPTNPVKTNGLFAGWFKESTLENQWVFDTDTVTADTTLFAKWDPAYTVTFDTDGGSEVEAQTIAPGGKVTKPADPTKGGSTFDDWYTDNTYATVFDFDTETVNSDITIYAQWV